jgi:hypothetical protein
MPFVVGQAAGLIAGAIMVVFFGFVYMVMRYFKSSRSRDNITSHKTFNLTRSQYFMESAKDPTEFNDNDKDKHIDSSKKSLKP